jgi:hypothetical protein
MNQERLNASKVGKAQQCLLLIESFHKLCPPKVPKFTLLGIV